MKKINLMIVVLCWLHLVQGQQITNITLFSETGEKFIVFMNGKQQNMQSTANLRMSQLAGNVFKAHLVFDNKSVFETTINTETEKDYTFAIKKNKLRKSHTNYFLKMTDVHLMAREESGRPVIDPLPPKRK